MELSTTVTPTTSTSVSHSQARYWCPNKEFSKNLPFIQPANAYILHIPLEILNKIISLQLPDQITIKRPSMRPKPPRDPHKPLSSHPFLKVAHISQKFRSATLGNPSNFTNLSITMPVECYDHAAKTLEYLEFILARSAQRPLRLSITLVVYDMYEDGIRPLLRAHECPCLRMLLNCPLRSLCLSALEVPTLVDLVVHRGINRQILTQDTLQHVTCETSRDADAWEVLRLLDALATRRFAGELTFAVGCWDPDDTTSLQPTLSRITTANITACTHGLQQILPSLPSLKQLTIRFSVYNHTPLPAADTHREIRCHDLDMLELRIRIKPDASVQNIIEEIQAPSLSTLVIDWSQKSGLVPVSFISALESLLSRTQFPIRRIIWIERRSYETVIEEYEGPVDQRGMIYPCLENMFLRLQLRWQSILQYRWVVGGVDLGMTCSSILKHPLTKRQHNMTEVALQINDINVTFN
ncbi:hypothetical protein VNI00_006458 [Paramarasmius palmivorus]|uniref:F-box domain-containing protein n=1 Tax=Paramarasmius palmivorus TaxID=297713 RepID=A0AAW0D7T6_9AGAR